MLELVMFLMSLFIGGFVGGYWLCAHIHAVAKAASNG